VVGGTIVIHWLDGAMAGGIVEDAIVIDLTIAVAAAVIITACSLSLMGVLGSSMYMRVPMRVHMRAQSAPRDAYACALPMRAGMDGRARMHVHTCMLRCRWRRCARGGAVAARTCTHVALLRTCATAIPHSCTTCCAILADAEE